MKQCYKIVDLHKNKINITISNKELSMNDVNSIGVFILYETKTYYFID